MEGEEAPTNGFAARWRAKAAAWLTRWGSVGVACLALAVGLTAMAALGVGQALFSDVLVAGPDVVISAPSVDADAAGVVTITPTQLGDDGLRIGWAVGSGLVLLGLGLALLTLAQAAANERAQPLFGVENTGFLLVRGISSGTLILIGGFLRWLLEGRVASAAGLNAIGLPPDDDYQLWVFDVPLLIIIALLYVVGWIWQRGSVLQDDADGVV